MNGVSILPAGTVTATRVWMISYFIDNSNSKRPQLMREVNLKGAGPVGDVIENLQVCYDILNPGSNPPALAATEQENPTFAQLPYIRDAYIFMGARSADPYMQNGNYVRNNLETQDLRENPPIFFRRALKIDDGSTISLGTCNSVPCGLTIVSENPVYLQGDYNNPGLNTNFSGTGVGASVIADAVTLLSDNWNDVNSFAFPYLSVNSQRPAITTTYRLAVAAGKGIPFLNSSGTIYQDFGTDGGTHNFLRFLENWGGQTLYYSGSIVSMYYSHQAVGTYKCCQNVYNAPSRGYQFDTNFLTPSLLPPLTPMLRTINTIGFTQTILPTE